MLSVASCAFVMDGVRGNLASEVDALKTTCFRCVAPLDPI